jgi:mono/diheme cytochrome c family protein
MPMTRAYSVGHECMVDFPMFRKSCIVAIVVTSCGGSSQADDKIDFQTQIQPIFAEHCAKCHGEAKSAAKMRLDSTEGIKQKWTADAELIVAGEPDKSVLYRRLVLPADDGKRMPKAGDPLPKELIDRIASWIKQGAVLPVTASAAPATASADNKSANTSTAAEQAKETPTFPQVPSAPSAAIDRLVAVGAQVMPLFAGSHLLQVTFAHRAEPASDAEVVLLNDVAEQVYSLDLAGCKATADGLATLSMLKSLSSLHLEHSTLTDEGLNHISGLTDLTYLNLYGTAITDAGLTKLSGLKKLNKLYLWQTQASFDAAMALEKEIPGLKVDLGYDNPGVVRQRLSNALANIGKQAEEAKAAVEKANQRLEETKKNALQLDERRVDLENQLKQLDQSSNAKVGQSDTPAVPTETPAK